MVPIYSAGKDQKHVSGAVIATVPRDDLIAASTEMEQRRNMLLVAFIICWFAFAASLAIF